MRVVSIWCEACVQYTVCVQCEQYVCGVCAVCGVRHVYSVWYV